MSWSDMNLGVTMEVCTELVEVPFELEDGNTVVDGGNYTEVMKKGFTVLWMAPDCGTCRRSGGRCLFFTDPLLCKCPNSDNVDPDEGCQTGKSILPI
ncbi:Concanavalin A-like lectin/glucanase, subgroup [Artemisia annua]|uniref:Concanavalin A-like lectin/glucanase, subgroup n=1 Tax=Artemisia annua TaxID=35608 RepID=A0A2U1MWC5_ARTAN|nr:Concanavalin A-like lectin/glucanase, subgroup [Artemisia annua]